MALSGESVWFCHLWKTVYFVVLMSSSSYWAFKNAESMDGLPGLRRGFETGKEKDVKPIKKMVGPYAEMVAQLRTRRANTVPVWYLIIVAVLSFCLGIMAILSAPSTVQTLRG